MSKFRRKSWRDIEVKLLKQWFPRVGPRGCLPIIPGRGLNAIKGKASNLGLEFEGPECPIPAEPDLGTKLLQMQLKKPFGAVPIGGSW